MSYRILTMLPSTDAEKLKERVETIAKAAKAVGQVLEAQGLVTSLMSDSTRFLVAMDGEAFVGLAAAASGRRWFDPAPSTSVLFATGPARPQMLEYLADMARMLGSTRLFYEGEPGDTLGGDAADMRVLKLD
jgi:hypothetical protein